MYLKFARPSLIEYIVEELKFDCAYAYRLNVALRRALEFAPLIEAIKARRLSVGEASRISASFEQDNVESLVEFACTHTFKQINAHLLGLKPDASSRESLRQVSKDQFRLFTALTSREAKIPRPRLFAPRPKKSARQASRCDCGRPGRVSGAS